MKMPLEISSRNVDLDERLRELIRDKASKLDGFYDHVIRCRVVVDVPHRSRQKTDGYKARIEITLPGGGLVVKREPTEDLYAAVTAAFDVAGRRLKEFAERQRGDVKTHEEKPVARVEKLFPAEGYGFLMTPTGRQIYFHRNSLTNAKFENLEVGAVVGFVEGLGEKEAQATTIMLSR